jgi:hypothetical protein
MGRIDSWTESGTSDHYYDYTDTYYRWEGSGVIKDKKTGISIQFNFFNNSSRQDPPKDLQSLLFSTDREVRENFSRRALTLQEVATDDGKKIAVPFICELLIKRISECKEPIKNICMVPVKFSELVEAGLAPDFDGQIHIALK